MTGILIGKKAFINKWSRTEESFPIEYRINGLDECIKVSLIMEIDSSSNSFK